MKPHGTAGGFACQPLAGGRLAGESACPKIAAFARECPWADGPQEAMKVNRSLTVAAPIRAAAENEEEPLTCERVPMVFRSANSDEAAWYGRRFRLPTFGWRQGGRRKRLPYKFRAQLGTAA